MRKTMTGAAVVALAGAAALALGTPGAHAVQPLAATPSVTPSASPSPGGCPSGSVCFYDGRDRTDLMWTLSGCGFHDLRPLGLHDRISSVWNRSEANVDLYSWGAGGWDPVDRVWIARIANYPDERDNTTDAVSVDC